MVGQTRPPRDGRKKGIQVTELRKLDASALPSGAAGDPVLAAAGHIEGYLDAYAEGQRLRRAGQPRPVSAHIAPKAEFLALCAGYDAPVPAEA